MYMWVPLHEGVDDWSRVRTLIDEDGNPVECNTIRSVPIQATSDGTRDPPP